MWAVVVITVSVRAIIVVAFLRVIIDVLVHIGISALYVSLSAGDTLTEIVMQGNYDTGFSFKNFVNGGDQSVNMDMQLLAVNI